MTEFGMGGIELHGGFSSNSPVQTAILQISLNSNIGPNSGQNIVMSLGTDPRNTLNIAEGNGNHNAITPDPGIYYVTMVLNITTTVTTTNVPLDINFVNQSLTQSGKLHVIGDGDTSALASRLIEVSDDQGAGPWNLFVYNAHGSQTITGLSGELILVKFSDLPH